MLPRLGMSGRVAIVCAHWPVHRTVIYMACELARHGTSVDLILYQAPVDDSLHLLDGLPVRVLELNREPRHAESDEPGIAPSIGARLLGKAGHSARRLALKFAPFCVLFSQKTFAQVQNLVRNEAYEYLLAVEKGGLALLGLALRAKAPPLIYLSLELYTSEHPLVRNDPTFAALRRFEHQFAPKIAAVIVQDEHRWQFLRADLRLDCSTPVIFLPISEPEGGEASQSEFLHELLAIPSGCKLLLYFGAIRPERDSLALAAIADRLPEGWLLVFHGPSQQDTRDRILAQSQAGRVRISNGYIPSAKLEALIGSASIGLAIYGEQDANDRLTGFASEKVALYLKAGVPVIARDNISYEHLWEAEAGLPVASLDAIPDAVSAIMKDHRGYRVRARAAFDCYYSFEKNFARAASDIASALMRERP